VQVLLRKPYKNQRSQIQGAGRLQSLLNEPLFERHILRHSFKQTILNSKMSVADLLYKTSEGSYARLVKKFNYWNYFPTFFIILLN
jgi:hypothetical protein